MTVSLIGASEVFPGGELEIPFKEVPVNVGVSVQVWQVVTQFNRGTPWFSVLLERIALKSSCLA